MRSLSRLALAFLLVPVSAFAGDVWKDKPYRTWTEKDVKKILSGSPWAKQILIGYYPQHGAGNVETTERINIMGGGGVNPTRDPMNTSTEGVWRPASVYTMRWASSQTIRKALLRQTMLRGGTPSASAESDANRETEEFELTLTSQSLLTDWPEVAAADWQAQAQLQARSTGRKVAPNRVEMRRGIDTSDGPSVVFFFPKKLPGGEPLIEPGETLLEFYTHVGPRSFRAKFNPTNMVARDGLDL